MSIVRRTAVGLLLLFTCTIPATQAQNTTSTTPPGTNTVEPDTLTYALEPIVVYSAPFALTTETAPFAVSTVTRSDAELSGNPALSLARLSYTVPGLSVNSRTHYALGERITMRGLGWRAQFGVRGIQVLMDGIPLTMADGQSILGVVDPAFIRTLEVIRGPASTFWGNSSGGVLYLSTYPGGDDAHTVRARQTLGSYGLSKTDLQVTPAMGPHTLTAYGSYLSQDGYREHSAVRLGRFGVTGDIALGEGRGLRVTSAYSNMPEAESPGSLAHSAVTADPTQARSAFVSHNAGKTSEQGQLGATYHDTLPVGMLRATAYGIFRDLENPLPFAYITVDRRAGGARVTLEDRWRTVEWGVGLASKLQRDDRVEYGISETGDRLPEEIQVDQLESVDNQAVFGRAALPVGRLRLSAGVRYDWLRFEAENRQDDRISSHRTFHALSPSVGVAVDWPATRLYANVSTGLEAPTTTELGNRPDGGGGFNPSIGPEDVLSFETGLQGVGPVAGLTYDVALFAMRVRDLLLPFQNIRDETFYRNEGRTRHLGLEAAIQWTLPHDLAVAASYTLNRARFTDAEAQDGTSLDGNEIPGVPSHLLGGYVEWKPEDAPWITIEYESASAYAVNSANTARTTGYVVFHARTSYPGLDLGAGATLQPFLAVNNLLDTRYSTAVVVNAFGGRYFEPAAGRHWQAGVALQFD